MKMIAITAFAALAAVGQSARLLSLQQDVTIDIDNVEFDQKVRFTAFKKRFNKSYKTIEEEAYAMEAFALVDADIQAHNSAGIHSYTKGHNHFSDIKPEHFKERIVGDCHKQTKLLRSPKADVHTYTEAEYEAAVASKSLDWRTKGAVTPVKNQGQCGSCWSFSTTGGVEGAYQVASGKLVSLSEQELVDCDKTDNGCSGGLMDNAFSWIKSNGGLPTESSYPYTARDGTCKTVDKVVTITGHTDVPHDAKSLLTAVAKQPVSIAVEADQSVFQSYKSGVVSSSSCGTRLDHGVLIAGYGTEDGKDYWLVKNSWGGSWGDEGYLKIERAHNICGIESSASYPTGAKAVGPSPGPSPPSPPTPPSPPSPPSPSGSHYEDPKGGCRSDEEAIQIQGVQGDACVPKCKLGIFCPSDVPSGVTAKPQCALQDQQGDKFCVLICTPSNTTSADQCGENASCKSISGVGICTYDD